MKYKRYVIFKGTFVTAKLSKTNAKRLRRYNQIIRITERKVAKLFKDNRRKIV